MINQSCMDSATVLAQVCLMSWAFLVLLSITSIRIELWQLSLMLIDPLFFLYVFCTELISPEDCLQASSLGEVWCICMILSSTNLELWLFVLRSKRWIIFATFYSFIRLYLSCYRQISHKSLPTGNKINWLLVLLMGIRYVLCGRTCSVITH